MSIVVVRDLCKVYEQGRQQVVALEGVDLDIGAGGLTAIVGESGSGKTTLLSLMGALDVPTRGRVWVLGREITAMGEGERTALRREHVGFVFQDFCLVRHATALMNAALPLLAARRLDRLERARALLERFGLGERLHHRPVALSRGEMQRVALARALVNEPEVLLADEPTGNLDEENERIVWGYLEGLREDGVTVVVATHNRELASRCDAVVRLHRGRVVEVS